MVRCWDSRIRNDISAKSKTKCKPFAVRCRHVKNLQHLTTQERQSAGLVVYVMYHYLPVAVLKPGTNGSRAALAALGINYVYADHLTTLNVRSDPLALIDPFGLADMNLFSPNARQFDYANQWNMPGVYTVAGHGNFRNMEDSNHYIIWPYQLAQRIRADPKRTMNCLGLMQHCKKITDFR
jgi:hypothetical protein